MVRGYSVQHIQHTRYSIQIAHESRSRDYRWVGHQDTLRTDMAWWIPRTDGTGMEQITHHNHGAGVRDQGSYYCSTSYPRYRIQGIGMVHQRVHRIRIPYYSPEYWTPYWSSAVGRGMADGGHPGGPDGHPNPILTLFTTPYARARVQ